MKMIASILLGLGLGLLALGVGLSASVTARAAAPQTFMNLSISDDCMGCHPTPTDVWHVIPHNTLLSTVHPTPSTCTSCHKLNADPRDTHAVATHQRIDAIRADIFHIYAIYPDGSTEQASAREVEVMLELIEADKRWGFHSADYIDAQLNEVQAMLDTLAMFSQSSKE
jgi:hypothetical protein